MNSTPDLQAILDNFDFFDDWQEKYEYLISLGKGLPSLPDDLKTDDRLVSGCQSKVWIDLKITNDVLEIKADSDAFIVKGILAIIIAAYHRTSLKHVLSYPLESVLDEIGLISHLSGTRGNGLKSAIAKVKSAAERDPLG